MDKCNEKDCKWFNVVASGFQGPEGFSTARVKYAPLVCVQCGCFIRDKYNKIVENKKTEDTKNG